MVRFRNLWKGTYIHIERGKLEVSRVHKAAHSAQWVIVLDKSHTGYLGLQNRWKRDVYLVKKGGSLSTAKNACK